jgi:hypothetical protein
MVACGVGAAARNNTFLVIHCDDFRVILIFLPAVPALAPAGMSTRQDRTTVALAPVRRDINMARNVGEMAATWNLSENFFSALNLGEVNRLMALQTRRCVATWKLNIGGDPGSAASTVFTAAFWT